MRILIRKVRINDTIPHMMHNDIHIRHAYRNDDAIIDEYDVNNPPSPYAQKYFCIESLEDNNTITLSKSNNNAPINRYYVSTDLQTWTEYDNLDGSWTINRGDKIYFKANAYRWFCWSSDESYAGGWKFKSTKQANIHGNIMSLNWGDNFAGKNSFYTGGVTSSNVYCFYRLFLGWKNLINANNLVLPVIDLTNAYACYAYMFAGCTSLLTTPKLPATSLSDYCYKDMFNDCVLLTTAPELPATNLATHCYEGMFRWCGSIETAPTLNATTIPSYAYNSMFAQCTKLTYCKCLAISASTGATQSFTDMFYNIQTEGTLVKDANSMISWNYYKPTNWTIQNA